MFERLGSLTYRFRFLIVLAWAALAAWAVLFAPSLASEGMTDQTAFLPDYAESMKAHDALERTFPGSTSASSATITFFREGGLTDADRAYRTTTAAWITGDTSPAELREAVVSVDTVDSRPEMASMLQSDDGALELMNVNLSVVMAGGAGDVVVAALRDHLASAPDGLETHVTGAAGIGSDYLSAIIAGTDSTTLVTVVLVILILLLIYRAPLAALVPLVTIGAAFVVARGTLGVLALAGWEVSSLLDTFIVVLIFGVGTDYAIFLISRYREEVARGDWHDASVATVGRIGAVISASAATVIVGLGAMAFGDFGMIQSTGPALAVGIFVTLVAGLTLTPALLAIFGHYLFWPRHDHDPADGRAGGFFARLADMVAHRPGLVTAALLVVLAIPVVFVPQIRTNFDVLAELPEASDARAGFERVATHLGRGKVFQSTGIIEGGAGVDLLEPASLAQLLATMQELRNETEGVASATSLVTPEGDGVLPDGFRPSLQLAGMADAFAGDDATGVPADSEALLDPEVTDGLETAATYLTLLGEAFPDVAAGAAYRAATERLATATDQVEQAHDGAVVSTQLRTLADAMTSPAAAAGGSGNAGDSVGIMGDYLDELAAAYPEVRSLPAFDEARAAADSLGASVTITAALDLSAALRDLAVYFDDRPAATLFPETLAGTAEAQEARREITATFEQLPVDLDALATIFAGRADDIFVPVGIGGDEGADLAKAVDAFVSPDRSSTRFYVATNDDPYSETGFAAVRRAQEVLADSAAGFGPDADAHLGGTTAQFADVQEVLGRDMERVGLITVIGILLVLMLLLRAVVAPLYLVGTVLLSYGTALGLSSWFFQEVLGQPGISFYLPILVFVLLVSLGSDYNIFLMSRVREESVGRPIRDGIRIASGRTGAVITSAGLILAGTFGSMATASLTVLFQVGVAVALGVLIDTFVVRSILVPAITTLFGERAWWPSGSALSRRGWPIVVTFPTPGSAGGGMSRRRLAAALGIVLLLPMLVAGLFVWSVANRETNLAAVTAAIVDLDTGTAVPAAEGTQRLDLGADLAAELTAGNGGDTFAWVVTDADDARAGLADGRYGAVLTIPADFSATIASITEDAGDPARAMLGLQTNDATSYALGSLASSVSAAIAASTSHSVTASYVDHVLVSVNATRDDLSSGADRAGDLAAGSSDLADGAASATTVADGVVTGLRALADGVSSAGAGVGELAGGTRRLASGTDQLADGAAALGQGARTAADGATGLAGGADALAGGLGTLAASTADLPAQTGKLATGARQLADGASQLGVGAHTAAGGASSLADGASRLAAGLGTLAGSTAGLPAQAAELASGARQVAEGATATATGARSLADGLAQLASSTTGLGVQAAALDAGAAALETGASDLAAGASALKQGAGALSGGAQDLALGAGQYAASVRSYTGSVATLAASCAALGGTDPLCGQLQALADAGGVLATGADGLALSVGDLAAGVQDVAAGADGLAAGAADVADGATLVRAGTSALATQAPQLESGLAALAGGASTLANGASQVSAGATALAGGTAVFAAQAPTLAGAISEAAGGAGSLASGAGSLASGVVQLATGVDGISTGAAALADGTATFAASVPTLAKAISDSAGGAQSLADGAGGMAAGVAQLATGVDGLATGARATAAGASKLADGTAAAADGASQLAAGMEQATEGASLVAAEIGGLAADGRAVADDAGDLATVLRDKAAAIPAYSEETRSTLGRAVADPVVVEQSRLNAVASPSAGLAPTILASALWLGAIAIFLVIPALLGALDRRRWWFRALAGFGVGALIGIVQALLTVLAVRFVLGVEVARLSELLAWSVLVAIVFVAVVQALVATLDNRGWLVALLFLALQLAAAGVLFPVETAPAILQAVYAVTPFAFAIEGLRALIAGGGPTLVPAFGGLAAWLVCSLLVTLAAAYRTVAAAPPVRELAAG